MTGGRAGLVVAAGAGVRSGARVKAVVVAGTGVYHGGAGRWFAAEGG